MEKFSTGVELLKVVNEISVEKLLIIFIILCAFIFLMVHGGFDLIRRLKFRNSSLRRLEDVHIKRIQDRISAIEGRIKLLEALMRRFDAKDATTMILLKQQTELLRSLLNEIKSLRAPIDAVLSK